MHDGHDGQKERRKSNNISHHHTSLLLILFHIFSSDNKRDMMADERVDWVQTNKGWMAIATGIIQESLHQVYVYSKSHTQERHDHTSGWHQRIHIPLNHSQTSFGVHSATLIKAIITTDDFWYIRWYLLKWIGIYDSRHKHSIRYPDWCFLSIQLMYYDMSEE